MEQIKKPVVIIDVKEYQELVAIKAERDKYESCIASSGTDEYIFKGKEYIKLSDSKIKVSGILDKFLAHPKIGPAIKSAISKEEAEQIGDKWLPVVVYSSAENREVYVRMEEQFNSKFNKIK